MQLALFFHYASFGAFSKMVLHCRSYYFQGLFHLECSLMSPLVFLKGSTCFHFWTCRVQLPTHSDCSRSCLILCLLAVRLFELYILVSMLNRLLSICLSCTVKLLVTLVLLLQVLAFFLVFIMLFQLKVDPHVFTCSNQRLYFK